MGDCSGKGGDAGRSPVLTRTGSDFSEKNSKVIRRRRITSSSEPDAWRAPKSINRQTGRERSAGSDEFLVGFDNRHN